MAHDFGESAGNGSIDGFDGRKVGGEKDVEIALENLHRRSLLAKSILRSMGWIYHLRMA